jgi:SNF2 family DNA or RNA helicase
VADEFSFQLRSEPSLHAKAEAFPYQQEAIDFVVDREYAAIFHEQGLGKTKIALDAGLQWLRTKQVDTIIIFTKKALIANWLREFEFHTELKPQVLTEQSSHNYYVFTTPSRAVLAHFEVAKKEEKRLAVWLRSRRVAVFLDESAKIKNPDADLTKSFHRLAPHFARRVIMTGTPVANRPYDIWSQIYFLDQGKALGKDFETFRKSTDLDKGIADDSEQKQRFANRLTQVRAKLARISVRETKDGGRVSLPSKEFERVICSWEPSQLELYRQIREELRAVVLRDGQLIEDDQDMILKRLLRLIQIASNPALVDDAYTLEPGKFPRLYELVTDITRRSEKVIVWTTFNENADWLARKLSPFGALALHGKLSMERRNQVISWFLKNAEDQVLVATPGAAKEGLTLTVANHVVFYDRTYSLDDYLQAQDRIHRVSQTKPCYVYTMLMTDSVDEWIESLLEEKRYAAQLTQGDIDAKTYSARATFSFVDILRRILDAA